VGNEAIIADRHEITDKSMGLNPASLADGHTFLYLDEWPDEAVISNHATI